jgi:lysyl endopeptidase
MIFQRIIWLVFVLVGLISLTGKSQISQGGEPMKTGLLKSSRKPVVEMPALNMFMIAENESDDQLRENELKPFRFAYPFEVNFTPENSGEWLHGENGFAVWKITIRSAGAKSLNIIFDEFKLSETARLFLYSEKENHFLGAFTSFNNKSSGKFAVSPVLGDEITVQYEIPENEVQNKPFRIASVNHDYIGILKAGGRRPLDKIAGACNIDINCDEWDDWNDAQNAVCRMIVNGVEVCTGVLVNNTSENQKPYILSAAHCYDRWNYAETTVYAFNYESPFCAPLDGDPLNTISGAKMKAQFDSLDFALAELSLVPPPNFRPYYAGWNRSSDLPSSTVCIHHPQGDIKKLAYDANPPSVASFSNSYTKNGFLKIARWENGVTESGSSGGPLFDANKNFIGTLTGGEATCKNPVNDYFHRFSMSWDFKTDSAKQLKYWLDPLKSGVQVLNGKQFYENENLCDAFTNLSDDDDYSMIPVLSSGSFAGYWGGSNNIGITEITERFSINGNETLSGVSFGVGKFKSKTTSSNSEIKIKVYNGNSKPERLIYSKVVKTSSLAPDAMNFIGFDEEVKPDDIFFVGFELSNIQPLDSFAVYQSLRPAAGINTFYFLQNNIWYNFKESNTDKKAMANIFEIVACNMDNFTTDTPLVDNPLEVLIFPNPSISKFVLEAGRDISENQVSVFNLLGQKTEVRIGKLGPRKLDLDLTGNVPGVYFVRLDTGNEVISRKISFVPW